MPAIFQDASAVSKMGLIASRGIELEDSYRSFSEKERQILSSLFEKLATTNEHGVMKVEIGPFRVSYFTVGGLCKQPGEGNGLCTPI